MLYFAILCKPIRQIICTFYQRKCSLFYTCHLNKWWQNYGTKSLTTKGPLNFQQLQHKNLPYQQISHNSCQVFSDAKIKRCPSGATSIMNLIPAARFHFEFGFIHSSSENWGLSQGKGVWWLQYISSNFMCSNKILICILLTLKLSPAQGGELWQSQSIHKIAMQAGYHLEPTG